MLETIEKNKEKDEKRRERIGRREQNKCQAMTELCSSLQFYLACSRLVQLPRPDSPSDMDISGLVLPLLSTPTMEHRTSRIQGSPVPNLGLRRLVAAKWGNSSRNSAKRTALDSVDVALADLHSKCGRWK